MGDDPDKGLATFARNDITVTETTEIAETDHILYIETVEIDVLAVWAMNDRKTPRQRNIGQVYTTLQNHPELVDENTVVAGDFNWNTMWDESPNSPLCGDFSDTRAVLNGLCSAYHELVGDEFGEETESTFHMHMKEEQPYHIDYALMPGWLMDSHTSITVGTYTDGIDVSDHMPLLVAF